MTAVLGAASCVHCAKQRSPDQRKRCAHCGLRKGDKRPAPQVRVEGKDLVVIASDPQELASAQRQMIDRLDEKIADAEREAGAAQAAAAQQPADLTGESATARALVAQAQGALVAASTKLATLADHRLIYLRKVKAALEAGYVMMPNFPGHVIAIRTARRAPPGPHFIFNASQNRDAAPAQADAATPAGAGTYVSPTPEHSHTLTAPGKQDIQILGWDDNVALPVEFLKPEIVQRTARALDLKIFDEVVLVRDGHGRDTHAGQSPAPRRGDPLVVGRIVLRKPGASRWERRVLSFLIAWFMDTGLI